MFSVNSSNSFAPSLLNDIATLGLIPLLRSTFALVKCSPVSVVDFHGFGEVDIKILSILACSSVYVSTLLGVTLSALIKW